MSITLTVNKISTSIKRIDRKLQNLPKDAYNVFKDITPVKTGYAKSKTQLRGNTIEANYPYAQVLDKGRHMTNRGMRGSTQAPKGMTKPTMEYIRKRVNEILRAK
jgi:hypothetical protein